MLVEMDEFHKLVNGRTVAIVGNAPTVNQYDSADTIDAADTVIRFNRFETGPGYHKVGTRTDVIACPIGWRPSVPEIWRITRAKPQIVVGCSPPMSETKADERVKITQEIAAVADVALMPEHYISDLHALSGCRPTSGLAVASYVFERCQPKNVFVTGFSFQKTAEHHYYPDQSFNYTIHDPLKDMHYIAQHWHDWKDRLQVDPHMMHILATGQPSYEAREFKRRSGKPYSDPHIWVYDQIVQRIRGAVLEVGAGMGFGIEKLKTNADVPSIVAIEPDRDSFDLVKTRHPDTPIQCTPLERFEAGDKFDNVTCVEVLEHLAPVDVHPFLAKLATLANTLYLSTPDRMKSNHGRRTPLEMRLALEAAGWNLKETLTNEWAALYIATKTVTA